MKNKFISIMALAIILSLIFAGCGNEKNMTNDAASLDEISSAVTAKIKTNLMETGAAVEEDFKNGILPSYNVKRLGDKDFYLPIEIDNSKLEDALVVTNEKDETSDMIVVLKAKNDSDVQTLENYVKKLRDVQYKTWEEKDPDQFKKVQQNMTRTMGRYVFYITYDTPQGISDEVDKLLK